MEERYRALRIIGMVYKVLGLLAAIATLMIVLSICATSVLGGAALGSLTREFGGGGGFGGFLSSALGGVVGVILTILYGGGFAITMYGFGEGVYLLIALEENTRKMAEHLTQKS